MILPLLLLLAGPAAKTDDPPVRIEINHDQFTRGDRARVYVEAADDGHLVVLHSDPDGRIRVLFPLDPTDDDFVRGGRRVEVRGRSNRDAFFVDATDGSGTVVAVLSPDALRFDEFVRNDHWDFRALGTAQQRDDPVASLLDIAHRMAGESHFEYDVATYVVGGGRYASHYGYGSDSYGYGYGYPSRFGIGLSFGYPWGYDPFCYDPFWGWSCGGRFGFGYSSYYYGRPYYYSPYYYRPYTYTRFSTFGRSFGGGSRFVIPRDRGSFTGIDVRRRSGFVGSSPAPRGSFAPRGVQPRGRSPSMSPRSPRSGGSSRGPSMSRPSGGSRGGGFRASPSRGGGGGGRSSGGGGGRRH